MRGPFEHVCLQAGVTQEAGFTHIAACQLQLDQASTTGSEAEDSWCLPQPPPQRLPTDPAAAVTAHLVSQQPLATEHQAHVLQRVMADGPGPVISPARRGTGTVPAQLLDAPPPMHHMLIVPHGPGEVFAALTSSRSSETLFRASLILQVWHAHAFHWHTDYGQLTRCCRPVTRRRGAACVVLQATAN